MVLPIVGVAVIVGTTVATLLSPYFLPKTEAEQATIELNKKFESNPQQFKMITEPQPIKVPSFSTKINQQLTEVKTKVLQRDPITIGAVLLIAFILIMMVIR